MKKLEVESFKIEWDAPEHEHKERSQDWFWSMGILSVAAAITAVIFGNIILAVLIVTAAFSLALFINRPPENVHVIIDERGITRGKIRYPFNSLKSFWLDEDHPHPKILLRSAKPFLPLIVVPLNKEKAVEINGKLSQFLTEEYHSLPFVEKVLEYLGF